MGFYSNIVLILASTLLATTLGLPQPKSAEDRTVVYFPDPQNEGSLIPAYLDGPGPIRPLVNSTESYVHFYLLTSNNRDKYYELLTDNVNNLKNSGFIQNAPLKVLTHGFGGAYKSNFPAEVAQAFLKKEENVNTISVDWSALAESPWYPIAAGSAKMVGDVTANLVKFLVEQKYVRSLDDVHVVGYSLGCHVAGNVGSALGGKVSRVTALDPAMPFFEAVDDDLRIDPTDGKFVDVVHTASGYLWENGLSFYEPRGHVDFYPNNGTNQPGCEGDFFGSCSHGRAVNYFIESFTSNEGFFGVKCDGWQDFLDGTCDTEDYINFGPDVPHTTRGTYFMRTNSQRPYALGRDGMNNGTTF